MNWLAIIVEFRVRLEAHDQFRDLTAENAAATLAREAGCLQFDVLSPVGEPKGQFVLYEIYADAAAFQAHLQTDHFLKFEKAIAAIILDQRVRQLSFAEADDAAASPEVKPTVPRGSA